MNYIIQKKNNLYVENIQAQTIAKKYKTPFYCYSLSQLKNNYHAMNNAFRTVKPIICFSVKSNSNLTLLKELKKMGSGADVVSYGELMKATKAGINPKKNVFSIFLFKSENFDFISCTCFNILNIFFIEYEQFRPTKIDGGTLILSFPFSVTVQFIFKW